MNTPPAPPASPVTGSPSAPGLPWLLADIGGTNARFGWVERPETGVEHIHKLAVSDFPGPAAAAQAYLETVRSTRGAREACPRRAALAVATAVQDDEVVLTNSAWRFSQAAMQQELGLQRLLVLNDFEALALSLPRLRPSQFRAWAEPPRPHGTMAVVGPGTGLGVGGVTQTARGWVALPGEGGHATLAPMDDFESDLLRWVRRDHAHVSGERLLSGIGLPLLHGAVAAVLGQDAPALSTEQIVARGVSGEDRLCRFTVDSFCALLGGFCGNVALTLGARGGLYVGGGIVPRFGERFFDSRFRERFESKGRFRDYLANIPVALVTDTLAALTGAAFALEQLED